MNIDKEAILEKGFLDIEIDARLDLFAEIERLKKEKNADILAHYYQEPDIQDVADYIGDSLGLAQQASKTDADIIVFAGVHFMAETAKILNPTRKVLLPDLKAGCSLADSAPAPLFRAFKEKYPDHLVVSYINCSAEMKALSDIICTSGNAEKIIESIPADQPIIFAPDKNLGAYLNKKTGRKMVLWNGACMVHEIFSLEKITKLKIRHPKAKLIAHPECEEAVLAIADYIGSTTQLLKYSQTDSCQEYIVATDKGIFYKMQQAVPGKRLIEAPTRGAGGSCQSCARCPWMAMNNLELIIHALEEGTDEVHIDPALGLKAMKPLQRMLDFKANNL